MTIGAFKPEERKAMWGCEHGLSGGRFCGTCGAQQKWTCDGPNCVGADNLMRHCFCTWCGVVAPHSRAVPGQEMLR